MNTTAISATEAAKHFLQVLELVEDRDEPAVIFREGRPVATLSPVPKAARSCTELAERWARLEKLPIEEAEAFADELEQARATLRSRKTSNRL